METNNIFTESYDDPIIDDSLDNEIDILSTDDAAAMDYDEIPDYMGFSIDDDNMTVTLERFCKVFFTKIKNICENDPDRYDTFGFYYYKGLDTWEDVREIDIDNDNLLRFVIWDNNFITDSSDIESTKLMSFKTIDEHVTFQVQICEKNPSSNGEGNDTYYTTALGTPRIKDIVNINTKIISIRDFADYSWPDLYFVFNSCDPEADCDEWTCDIECARVEYEDY